MDSENEVREIPFKMFVIKLRLQDRGFCLSTNFSWYKNEELFEKCISLQ